MSAGTPGGWNILRLVSPGITSNRMAAQVKDIMTRDVITVSEETNLADVATLLETHRIKRVPVMREGKIVGIVSRSNLYGRWGRHWAAPASGASASDDDRAIRTRLLAELESTAMGGQALGTGHHRQQRDCSSMVWVGRA